MSEEQQPLPPREKKLAELQALTLELSRISDPVVVLGVDEASGDEFIVYGRADLECSVATNTSAALTTVRVPILLDSEELEHLLAAVQAAKGRHDYQGGKPTGTGSPDPSAGNDDAGSSESPETAWWHVPAVDAQINQTLLQLKKWGLAVEDRLQVEEDAKAYVKVVARLVARALTGMPAVQKALNVGVDPAAWTASTDADRRRICVDSYRKVVRAVAALFGQDGDAMLAAMPINFVEGRASDRPDESA
jgi:hypothetical protein